MCARKKKRKPWTVQEVRTLEQHAHEGIGNLKKLLPGRSEHAIKHTASRYGISLVAGALPHVQQGNAEAAQAVYRLVREVFQALRHRDATKSAPAN